jgi:protein-tyrosine phosphatase
MWDFHSHILPFIDDGAKNIEEFIEMSKIAANEGITKMFATPHYIPNGNEISREELLNLVDRANDCLKKENIPLKILPAMEVYADWGILEGIDKGEILTLNKSRYILVELPMVEIPDYIEELFFELKLRDLTPIIAHPERNLQIQEKPRILMKWVKRGVLIQINTGSLMGLFGSRAQKTARFLLRNCLVHILGTDAHSSNHRPPSMKKAIKLVKRLRNEKQTKLILKEYPRRIFENQPIKAMENIDKGCIIRNYLLQLSIEARGRFSCFQK